ncbi:MAG: transglutaminase domain-containing protein, partial [Leifsonia sp.]
LTDDVERDRVRTNIQVDTVVSSWLPVPYPATKITGLDGEWQWDDGPLTVSSDKSTTRGQNYTVEGLELKPTAQQLRASGNDYPGSIRRFLELPEDTPPVIAATALEVVGEGADPYDAAIALQKYFRSSAFAYSTEAPVDEGYDGGSLDVIATFLDVKKGYCIHFASAMAVMARTLGIPSRIALGYAPGDSTRETFESLPRWDVTTHDLHVWPELYFPGVGWVPFEPTTGRGSIPDYARGVGAAATGTLAPSQNDQANRDAALAGRDGSDSGSTTAGADMTVWFQIGAVVLGVVVLLLLPLMVRSVGRLRRRRRVASGRASPSLLWRELVDTATDLGIPVPETETARHLADRLGAAGGRADEAGASLARLLDAVEHERYARPGSKPTVAPADLVEDLDRVLAALRAGASTPLRLRALFLPTSLRPEALGPGGRRTPTPA